VETPIGEVIEACVACANAYGVADELKALGFDVKGMGKPLTEYLKSGKKVLTFQRIHIATSNLFIFTG
jgi:hypothetical protein